MSKPSAAVLKILGDFEAEIQKVIEETKQFKSRTLRVPDREPMGDEKVFEVVFFRRRENGVANIHRFIFLSEVTSEERFGAFHALCFGHAWFGPQEAVRSVSEVIGWSLKQFKASYRDWDLLQAVFRATNGGKPIWFAYLDEKTGEFAYGDVDHATLSSLLVLLNSHSHGEVLKELLCRHAKPIGSNIDDFLFVLEGCHPADRREQVPTGPSAAKNASWIERWRIEGLTT
jgi:hypothetical protein